MGRVKTPFSWIVHVPISNGVKLNPIIPYLEDMHGRVWLNPKVTGGAEKLAGGLRCKGVEQYV